MLTSRRWCVCVCVSVRLSVCVCVCVHSSTDQDYEGVATLQVRGSSSAVQEIKKSFGLTFRCADIHTHTHTHTLVFVHIHSHPVRICVRVHTHPSMPRAMQKWHSLYACMPVCVYARARVCVSMCAGRPMRRLRKAVRLSHLHQAPHSEVKKTCHS